MNLLNVLFCKFTLFSTVLKFFSKLQHALCSSVLWRTSFWTFSNVLQEMLTKFTVADKESDISVTSLNLHSKDIHRSEDSWHIVDSVPVFVGWPIRKMRNTYWFTYSSLGNRKRIGKTSKACAYLIIYRQESEAILQRRGALILMK